MVYEKVATSICHKYAPFVRQKLSKLINPAELRLCPMFNCRDGLLVEDTIQIASKAKNTINMKPVSFNKFKFYDGEKYIGQATFSESMSNSAPAELLPKSWYIPNGIPDEVNRLPTYPRLYIDEIVIVDKLGVFNQYQQRTNGKKYGTMCMQKILEYAEQNGYGTRLSLGAAKHGSNIHPGKFYAKIGFEPGPKTIEFAQKQNERYYRGIKYLEEHPDTPEEIKESLLNDSFYEKIDGRFISYEGFASELFLTRPDILKNYPI